MGHNNGLSFNVLEIYCVEHFRDFRSEKKDVVVHSYMSTELIDIE